VNEKMSGNRFQQKTGLPKENYLVITPARNESAFIEKTIKSMISQTVLPCEWIIVDDGSTDDTPEIVAKYSQRYGWIKLIRKPASGKTRDVSGGAPARAFNFGLRHVSCANYDFIANVDADLSFEPRYFELLLKEFANDSQLGIAGGNLHEFRKGVARPRKSYLLHVAGATKTYRRKCFWDIGGIVESTAWDAIDEITARMKGWKTRTIQSLKALHHRRTFSSERNILVGFMRRGRIDYLLGFHPLFELLKWVGTMVTARPYVLSGLSMSYGYMKAALRREQRPVTREFVKYLRKTQIQRLLHALSSRDSAEMGAVAKRTN
jgi:biofilm PGA synthesis N-glycosyltransferase PgaC